MKQIPLTQGKFSLVDDDIYELIWHLKWCALKDHDRDMFYAGRASSRKDDSEGKQHMIMLHHVVQGHPFKGFIIDHIDGNGLNNQRDNLRIVPYRKNTQNSHKHRSGKLVGTSWHKSSNKWMSEIRIGKTRKYLGLFKTEQEAHEAYLKALKMYMVVEV